MNKKITKVLIGLFLGVLGSLGLLFILRNKDNKEKFSFRKLFTFYTLQRLSLLYDIIIEGMPSQDQGIATNILYGLRSANKIYEFMFQIGRHDKFAKFVENENLELSANKLILPLIKNTKLKELIKENSSAYDLGNGFFIKTYTFPDGDKVFVPNIDANPDNPKDFFTSNIALSKGFNLQAKLDMFWQFYKEGIFIRSFDDYSVADFDQNSENLVIEELATIDYKFYGKTSNDMSKFLTKIDKFRKDGIQRNYLLLGLPGVGKTSFAIEASRKISNRVIKISADLFRNFNQQDINFIFDCIKPDSVIIDDFDRVYDDMTNADMLYFFERLKTQYKHVTVFCTINNIQKLGEAMIRPGRFDEIMVFHLPDPKDRKIMLEAFINDLNLETKPTEAQLKRLVELTNGFSPAYIKEYVLQLKYEPDFKELIRRINMTRQFVNSEDFGTGELEDV